MAAAHPDGFLASVSFGGWLERSGNATANLESQGEFLCQMDLEPSFSLQTERATAILKGWIPTGEPNMLLLPSVESLFGDFHPPN